MLLREINPLMVSDNESSANIDPSEVGEVDTEYHVFEKNDQIGGDNEANSNEENLDGKLSDAKGVFELENVRENGQPVANETVPHEGLDIRP